MDGSGTYGGSEKDLLALWEDLLGWSENASVARKLQEDMIVLKQTLNRLGNKSSFELLDTEPSIQIAIEALKNEKTQLHNFRTNMLRLNASVHRWLTRQENKTQKALDEQQLRGVAAHVAEEITEKAITAAAVILTNQDLQEAQSEQIYKSPSMKSTTSIAADTETVIKTAIVGATRSSNSTTIMVTDSNGSQVEAQHAPTVNDMGTSKATVSIENVGTTTTTVTTSTVCDKTWDLNTLISSENEFHKHLKNEVSDMYSAWDEADARINSQLDVLTTSLIAWRQLECGLSEFQQALGQDRGTLKGLEGALDKGQATPIELAQNVKLVAKLLSEKVNVSQEQLNAVQEHFDATHFLHIAKFASSNGSLSDSGISDGGATSDGGLSERERRLGVLRRLAKQLESALAPGSEAMKSIAARMESAEAELKNLQNTCRDLIVRTAANHQNKKQRRQLHQQQPLQITIIEEPNIKNGRNNAHHKVNGHVGIKRQNGKDQSQHTNEAQTDSPSKRKNKRKQRKQQYVESKKNLLDPDEEGDSVDAIAISQTATDLAAAVFSRNENKTKSVRFAVAPDSGDPSDDPPLEFDLSNSDNDDEAARDHKNNWLRRIAKAALPMQMALITFLLAAAMMQPNCCDNLNNLAMSFSPQLRYIRGPPPI